MRKDWGISPSVHHKSKYIGRILDCFSKGIHFYIAFIQSNRPEVAVPDSYDNCEPGFSSPFGQAEKDLRKRNGSLFCSGMYYPQIIV